MWSAGEPGEADFGKAGDHALGGSCHRRHLGLRVERAGSARGFRTCSLSNEACSVTGPEEQRQVGSGVCPHRAHGKERWRLPEEVREGSKGEVCKHISYFTLCCYYLCLWGLCCTCAMGILPNPAYPFPTPCSLVSCHDLEPRQLWEHLHPEKGQIL